MQYIHIIALNLPNPPDYGGVIDIYYRIKNLHEQGVKIILHAFVYGRQDVGDLEKYCEKIYLYKRKTGILSSLSSTPYIIKSRRNKFLLQRLLQDNYPILFDGLHSCYYLNNPLFINRIKLVRVHNVEHDYYHNLFKTESNYIKKLYFYTEALKLKKYEKKLHFATKILSVAQQDFSYFSKKYSLAKVQLIPSFHCYETCETTIGEGKYALFHGNLSVHENIIACDFLIHKIFESLDYPLIIAGKNPSEKLVNCCANKSNITLIANPSEEKMKTLIQNAHIHTLYTEQDTGLKLKLIYSLFNGRHILVNDKMLKGTDLHKACHIANETEQWKENILKLSNLPFTEENLNERIALIKLYDNTLNAKNIISLIEQYGN